AVNVRQLHKVGAMAAAISGLTPLPYDGKTRFQILAGAGTYGGRQAYALGVGYYARESLMMTFGMAASGSEQMARLGIAWKLGRGGSGRNITAANSGILQDTSANSGAPQDANANSSALQEALRERNAQIRQMQEQLELQQAQTKQQRAQNEKQQAQIKQLQEQVKQLQQTEVWR
ncbi:MAG TPA: hypothetical protein DEA44_17440, partial [Firmicutes bacterium]|nr:hypothetical protein [Bacillota bacterium]